MLVIGEYDVRNKLTPSTISYLERYTTLTTSPNRREAFTSRAARRWVDVRGELRAGWGCGAKWTDCVAGGM